MNESSFILFRLTDELVIEFAADLPGISFLCLAAFMWILAGIYALKYKDHQKNNIRFFTFYLLTFLMLAGLSLAANYMTMYLFFEMMTLLSVPLVLHNATAEATEAARKYLFYSIFGATLGLLGFFFVSAYGTTMSFVPGGVLDSVKMQGKEAVLLVVAFLTVAGFGAKAGLYPLHVWLPAAHPVAPAPASALLSGVITKAGVFCILRVIYYIFGMEFLKGTWVQSAWLLLALTSIMLGSVLAYKENKLKTRLAYSTISQVSYILLGLFFMNKTAFIGALLHVVYHSVIKNALFMSAGNIIYSEHKENVDELKGIGVRMPVTMSCFAVLSLSLIGIPPFSGFISKWNLAQGALASGLSVYAWLAPAILIVSALLTAGYLLPIVIDGFFPGADDTSIKPEGKEISAQMLLPVVVLSVTAVGLSLFAQPLILYTALIAEKLFY
jgi:formate hydrogenlyase subunit 3/multisubunit Na+/H+ antiporter MnhD subunit